VAVIEPLFDVNGSEFIDSLTGSPPRKLDPLTCSFSPGEIVVGTVCKRGAGEETY
jgi:hypothetical protein